MDTLDRGGRTLTGLQDPSLQELKDGGYSSGEAERRHARVHAPQLRLSGVNHGHQVLKVCVDRVDGVDGVGSQRAHLLAEHHDL